MSEESPSHQFSRKASLVSKERGSSSLCKEHKIEILIDFGKYKNDVTCISSSKDNLRSTYPVLNLRNPNYPDLPSDSVYNKQALIMDVSRDDKESFYSINQMRTLIHQNILHCYFIKEVDDDLCKLFNKEKNYFKKDPDTNYLMVFIEVIHGSLGEVIARNFGELIAYKNKYIPSPEFTSLVWTIIKAIQFIHSEKSYHGNFSLWSTCFVYEGPENDRQVIAKLANFVEKKVSLDQAQLEDWIDFGNFFSDIRLKSGPHMFNVHLDRVIQYFGSINSDRIAKLDEDLHQFDFFKTPEDRRRYARKLYWWCDCELNVKYLRSYQKNLAPMPWNKFKTFCGNYVLKKMNDYRDPYGKKGDSSKYKTNDVVDLLRFVSGVYAHYNSLDVPQLGPGLEKADGFICEEFPDLFYKLRGIEDILDDKRIRQKQIDRKDREERERKEREWERMHQERDSGGGSSSGSGGRMGQGRSHSNERGRGGRDWQGRGRSEGRGREHGGPAGGRMGVGRSRSAEP